MLIEWTPPVLGPEPGRTQVPAPPDTLINRWKRNSPPFLDGVHWSDPRQVPSGPDRGVVAAAVLGAAGAGVGATAGWGGGAPLAAASALAFSSSALFLISS